MLRGRRLELDRAISALGGVHAARGAGAVVVDGDAGMGKTALFDAVVAGAVEAGATVLRGRGHALGAGLAYGPIANALSRHLHGLETADRERTVAGLGSLALLVEGIGTPPAPGDPELERARMFQAVSLLLSRLATGRPLVVGIDDLHWADTATVELLEHLVAELRTEAVGFVVATRPGDLAARPDTRHLVAELLRLPAAVRVAVGPLDAEAVAAVVADRLGGRAAAPFVAELLDRTGGVPLAVEAVLGALLADGRLAETDTGWAPTVPVVIPGYVVDLFGQRLDGLDRAARSVVEAVAVADGPLTAAEAAVVLATDADAAAGALAVAARAGLLVEVGGGGWETTHPLVGSAALDRLPEGGRRRLHAAFASLPRLSSVEALDHRARHVVAAGDAVPDDVAADVLARAGHRAAARGAADVAARWLTAAADRATSAGVAPHDVAELLAAAADASQRRSDHVTAIAARARAVDLLAATDPAAAARAAAAVATLCWQLGSDDAQGWWDRSLALADEAGPVERLRTRHGQLGDLLRQGRIDEATTFADHVRAGIAEVEALPADEIGSVVDTARHRLLMFECFTEGRPAEALLEHEVSLPPDAPPATVVEVEGVQLDALVLLGRFDEARRRAEDLLRRLGPDATVTQLAWRPVVARAYAHLVAGAWDDAADVLAELVDESPVVRTSRAFWLGVVALRRGDLDGARALAADARRGLASERMALRRRYLDVIDGAADVLAGVVPTVVIEERPDEHFAMAHVLHRTLVAEVLVAQERRTEARAVASWLRARGRTGSYPHAVADRLDALATDDAAGLARAATALDRFGVPFDAAVARLEAAERDRATVPEAQLVQAAELFERFGAAPWAARAQALGARTDRRRGPVVPELTRREREVAELVAEGLTNGQVAERLGVSIRTVTSHLDHAYTKLGIGSRAALVAHVLRLPAAVTT